MYTINQCKTEDTGRHSEHLGTQTPRSKAPIILGRILGEAARPCVHAACSSGLTALAHIPEQPGRCRPCKYSLTCHHPRTRTVDDFTLLWRQAAKGKHF